MAETTPITTAPAMVSATPLVPTTPQVVGGPVGRCSTYSPPAPTVAASKNLVNVIKGMGSGMETSSILKKFEWQTKDRGVKNQVMTVTSHVVFTFNKTGSAYIQPVYSAGQLGGTRSTPRNTRVRS